MEAWMLGRQERELALVTELSHLISFPSPTTPTCGSTSPGLCVDGERLLQLRPGVTTVAGGGRRRGRKRVRDKAKLLQAYDEDGVPFPANAKPLGCSKTSSCTKMKQQKTPTVILITTVPDFDGYQWRKYGQKPIEGANYPRSYYRCTNSTDQGCCAKRTVQRNDNDDINGVAGGARYTVTYISEHTCKSIDSPAPVILETTAVRASQMQQQRAAPDDDDTCTVAAAFTAGSCSSSTSASTRPPSTTSTSSDIITATGTAWSTTNGDTTSWGDEHRDCGQLFAGDDDCRDRDTDATPVVISAAGFLDEMDFAGPIRSPVHITAGGWVDDNLLFDGLLDMSGAGRISRMFDL